MRNFTHTENLFRVPPEVIEQLTAQADAGDALACFKVGRYHYVVQPDEDSIEKAIDYIEKAQEGGIIEADVAKAIILYNGDSGLIDREEAHNLLDKGLDHECEFAAELFSRNIINGNNGYKVDRQLAIRALEALIPESDNPMYYFLYATALEAEHSLSAARPWYEKAYNAGFLTASVNLAVCRGYNDDYELVDQDAYRDTLHAAAKAGDPTAYCVILMDELAPDIFEQEEPERTESQDKLIEGLEWCAGNGCVLAAHYLGEIYRYGQYGIEKDIEEAYSWHCQASQWGVSDSYEALYTMVAEAEIDFDPNEIDDVLDYLALQGARSQNEAMLRKAVERYNQGGLKDFDTEIEAYHIPAYNALPDEPEDDEPIDDDGRYDPYV